MTINLGVSYFGVRRVKHVQQDMEDLARHGATYVEHVIDEQDFRGYYGTLGEIFRVTRATGLGIWVDLVDLGYVLGGGDFLSDWVLWHPEAAQVDPFGKSLPAACPNQPAYREFVRGCIDKAAGLGPDGLFWDEPHLFQGAWYNQPERWGCNCAVCQALYRERFGGPLPLDPAEPSLLAFQSETMLQFLGEMMAHTRAQGMQNGVTVLPHEFQRPGSLDWEAVAALPGLDLFGTDPYPFPAFANQASRADVWRDFVRGYAEQIVAVSARHGVEPGLAVQGFSVPADDSGYLDEIWELAAGVGITDLCVWGFDGHRDMSQFSCEAPDAAWEKIGRGMRRLRDKVTR